MNSNRFADFTDRSTLKQWVLCSALALLSASVGAPSLALEDDQLQRIRIKADSAERDDKRGISTYRGDVVIDQGSLNIIAEEVIIYGAAAVTKIVATGKPARLRQKPKPEKGFITARGNQIEYTITTEMVRLESDAYVEQDGTEVRGDEITYDMAKQIVRANGAAATNGRIEIIIPPAEPSADSISNTPSSDAEAE